MIIEAAEEQVKAVAACGFEILPYRELPAAYRKAIAWLWAMDHNVWQLESLGKPERRVSMEELDALIAHWQHIGYNPRAEAFNRSLPSFLERYGDMEFGVATIPTGQLKARVVDSLASHPRLTGMDWDAYANWYVSKTSRSGDGRLRDWPAEDRWPVILSASADAVIDDGWHRFHSYARAGHDDIPAVFVPSARHYELLIDRNLAAASLRRVGGR